MRKKNGKGNRSGKRVVGDLPLSDVATPGVKGGSIFSSISKAIGGAAKGGIGI